MDSNSIMFSMVMQNYYCLFETMVSLESVGDNTNTGGSAVVGVVTSNFISTTFPGKE